MSGTNNKTKPSDIITPLEDESYDHEETVGNNEKANTIDKHDNGATAQMSESHVELDNQPRSRKMTEKGKEYNIECLEKHFRAAVSSWKKKALDAEETLTEAETTSVLKEIKHSMKDAMKLVTNAMENLDVEVDRPEIHHKYEFIEDSHLELMQRICKKIEVLNTEERSNISSNYPESTRSNHSLASSSGRAKVAAKAAKLKCKINNAKEIAEVKAKLDILNLTAELKGEEARLKVLEDSEASLQIDVDAVENESRKGIELKPKDLINDNTQHLQQNDNITSENKPFGDKDYEMLSSHSYQPFKRIPLPEPEIFSGDPLKYPSWICSFELLIESQHVTPRESLFHLKRYVSGEAKEAIESLFMLRTADAYTKAREVLEERYGKGYIVANSFREKLDSWQKIAPNDNIGLRRFSDFLGQCLTAMTSVKSLRILNDEKENQALLRKLPDWLIGRWCRKVAEHRSESGAYPSFKEFHKFISKEALIMNDPIASVQAVKGKMGNTTSKTQRTSARVLKSSAEEQNKESKQNSKNKRRNKCVLCESEHDLDDCMQFKSKTLEQRKEFIRENRLCFACFKPNHKSAECRNRKTCEVCSRRHPTTLHEYNRINSSSEPQTSAHSIVHVANSDSEVGVSATTSIVPVWISHKDHPDVEVPIYALLDNQSDTTFVSSNTVNALGVSGIPTNLKMSTMSASAKMVPTERFTGLRIRAHYDNEHHNLPAVFSNSEIPMRMDSVPTPEVARRWPHLERLAEELLPLEMREAGILIGYDCPSLLMPKEVIPSPENNSQAPYAVRTILGWSLVGGQNIETETSVTHHSVTYCFRTRAKEVISPIEVARLMEQDVVRNQSDMGSISIEEKRFIDILTSQGDRNGVNYQFPLPFKHDNPMLPNNRILAEERSEQLRRRLLKDEPLRNQYSQNIENLLTNGYAEKADKTTDKANNWYIPHHGVRQKSKPEKLRIVFDCSAKYKGHSLNNILLKGPDLTCNLIGLLCRARKEEITILCDIKEMFHQFKVTPECRSFLKFLWWPGGDLNKPLSEYQMAVHLFGATSSPGCAHFGLKKIADDYESRFGSKCADFLRSNFYVDDGIISVASESEAIELLKNTRAICEAGGLHVHKIASNSRKVLESVPEEDRAKNVRERTITDKTLPVERALGVDYCLESDCFRVNISVDSKGVTRRSILSTISSTYDPFGFLAPVLLEGKQILQEVCANGLDWDDIVPEPHRAKWKRWIDQLVQARNIYISRCFKPQNFGTVVSVQLHHFSDGSLKGYGQCSYLRLENDIGQVHCSLVYAKARVAPIRPVTVPRLELSAAVISAEVNKMLEKELNYNEISHYFYTDSKVVLGYLQNHSKRFHIYVSNRIQRIQELSNVSNWSHVKSEENPADLASRGCSVESLQKSYWFLGPSFLWSSVIVDKEKEEYGILEDDPEVKRICLITKKDIQSEQIIDWRRFSKWTRLKRTLGWCIRFTENLKKAISDDDKENGCLTVHELERADHVLIKEAQREMFPFMYNANKANNALTSLDPFKDKHGIIRVGGRFKQSSLYANLAQPIIISGKHHLAKLLIGYCHDLVAHQGRGITLSSVREHGWWITNSPSTVRDYIRKCVICKRLRGPLSTQKMAEIPLERAEEQPPFTYVGVDYFGPFQIKEGRKMLKRWGVLFTCLNSRAIHLETAASLDTSSFVNAFRRFQSIRGPIRLLRSDQGTNFVGAYNEFMQEIKKLDTVKVKEDLTLKGCEFEIFEFKTNPPNASNFGGCWERQIRTVRSVLNGILVKVGEQLDDECLRTLLAEVSAIVNSRPIAVEYLSDHTTVPLTPNMLLTSKSNVLMPPPGHFMKTDLYAIKRWRRVQHLANLFWERWRKEYISQLQNRQKWQKEERNMLVGDIVIISSEESRSKWQIAKVVEAKLSKDNLVRSVIVEIGDRGLDKIGRRNGELKRLERPCNKLVLLKAAQRE